jgi:hypothetical protein
VALLFIVNFLLYKFFFKTGDDREPEITNLKESNFDFTSSKPYYFKVDNKLCYAADGKLNYELEPIWKGEVEESFVSPNSRYILIYADKELTLIDSKGQRLFNIDNCTGEYAVEEERKSGRFVSMEIQWSKNSDFFLVAQDKVWEKNFSKNNKSSIYKYSISDKSFKPFIDLNDELINDFFLSQDGNYLYYEFATAKGDLAFKKVDIKNNKVVSEHFQDDSLKLTNINADRVFINYNEYKDKFQGNSFDLQSIITDASPQDSTGLYFKDKDTTAALMFGTRGYGAFKGNIFSFFRSGFFLPGNKYFVANISAKNFIGQLVIDTKTFQIIKLKKQTEFYFNINSNDCDNFVFRYEIEPNVKFATSVSLEIEGLK